MEKLTVATWNVNSVRMRLLHLTEWLRKENPHVVLLQELKCEGHNFPKEAVEDLGYNVAIHGQKTFNGVAILAKCPLEDVCYGLPTFQEDTQSRYIEALVGNVRVASVYVPNGQAVGCDKYAYKLTFLERLRQHMSQLLEYDEVCIVGGDYNIAPNDADVHDPKAWGDGILCSPEERKAFRALLNLGYADAMRLDHTGIGPFSWWDYRNRSFSNNEGLRIDHLLLSPKATDNFVKTWVDSPLRGLDKPSDHAPVWCQLKN
jgi:exodeoxyribonuclease-3